MKINCPHCNQRIEVGPEHSGIVATCPNTDCVQEFIVPQIPATAPERPHDQQSSGPSMLVVVVDEKSLQNPNLFVCLDNKAYGPLPPGVPMSLPLKSGEHDFAASLAGIIGTGPLRINLPAFGCLTLTIVSGGEHGGDGLLAIPQESIPKPDLSAVRFPRLPSIQPTEFLADGFKHKHPPASILRKRTLKLLVKWVITASLLIAGVVAWDWLVGHRDGLPPWLKPLIPPPEAFNKR